MQTWHGVGYAWVVLLATLPLASEDKPKPTGTIVGVVRFVGDAPAAETITVGDGSTIQHRDLVVDPKSKGLRYVFAVLDDAPVQPAVKALPAAYMDQRDWVFLPRVVAVQHGQAVRFDNNDAFNHSVMTSSLSPANQLNVFITPGQPLDQVFAPQERPILVGCALHAWMRAWVFVVRHPWFAVTDEQGRFRLDQIPPGKFTLRLTHPDSPLKERRSVEVPPGKTLELTIDWRLPEKR